MCLAQLGSNCIVQRCRNIQFCQPTCLRVPLASEVMMFGMTGAGKSALGNLIAGQQIFDSGALAELWFWATPQIHLVFSYGCGLDCQPGATKGTCYSKKAIFTRDVVTNDVTFLLVSCH